MKPNSKFKFRQLPAQMLASVVGMALVMAASIPHQGHRTAAGASVCWTIRIPASRWRLRGQRPELRKKFEVGQWAMAAPDSAMTSISRSLR